MNESVKTILTVLALALLPVLSPQLAHAQFYSVKMNALSLAAGGTLNLEGEVVAGNNWTLNVVGQWNPWEFGSDGSRRVKQITVSPGARYWFGGAFNYGWFMGWHGIASRFNMSNMFGLNRRYDGRAYGGGMSAGFSIPLTKRWNIEYEVGVAGAWSDYRVYDCGNCGQFREHKHAWKVIPSRVGVNMIYLF